MRYQHVFFYTFLLFSTGLRAQSRNFIRQYSSERYSDARGLVAAGNGCFVFTGLDKGGPDSLGDMFLAKVNAAGAMLWKQYYGRAKEDGGNAVMRTSDGGFLLTGHTALSYGLACDGYIVKTDADGEEQWRSFIGTAYDDVCSSSVQAADGAFYSTGRTENGSTRTFRVMLAKTSRDGKSIFLKELSTSIPAIGLKIAECPDGNLLIAGFTVPDGSDNSDFLVLKCSPDGTVWWERIVGTALADRAYGLAVLADGSCIAVGGASDAAGQPAEMLAVHLDEQGEVLQFNTAIAGADAGYLYDIQPGASGEFALAGVVRQGAENALFPVLAVMDSALNIRRWYAETEGVSCRTRCMAQDAEGNYVLAGNVEGTHNYGIFFSKINQSDGPASAHWEAADHLLFPNPFSDFTYLKVGHAFQEKTLLLYSSDARCCRMTRFTSPELIVYRESLPAGVYGYSVLDAEGRLLARGKLEIH